MKKAINKIRRRIIKFFSPNIIRRVIDERLSFLDASALNELFITISNLEKLGVPGEFIEAGCALGGSAIVIASAKKPDRPFYIYDVFEMIPSPSEKDGQDAHQRYEVIASGNAKGIKENIYYGYEMNLLNKVKNNFKKFSIDPQQQNIHFKKGLFQDTLQIINPVAFAHIDSDWHDSVMTCLQRIEPHLVSNGVIVIDDYQDWEGCRKAVNTYFEDKSDQYDFIQKSRLHITRK